MLRLVMRQVVFLVTLEIIHVVRIEDTTMDLLVRTVILLVRLVVVQVPLHVRHVLLQAT